jgi:hypothetical protein
VDFIAHQYPLLEGSLIDEGIRMTGLRDIAAMKLNAIVGKGTRVKDFIDVAYLSSYLTSVQILQAYQGKYVNRNPLMAVKSLVYHQDIDSSEPIDMLDKNYAWQFVEKRLNDMLAEPEKHFEALSFASTAENDLRTRRGR